MCVGNASEVTTSLDEDISDEIMVKLWQRESVEESDESMENVGQEIFDKLLPEKPVRAPDKPENFADLCISTGQSGAEPNNGTALMELDKDKPKFEVAAASNYVLSGIVRTKACRESTELLTVREEVGGNYLCNDDEYTEFVFKEAEEVPPHEEIKATDDAIRVEEVFGNKNCVELKEFKNDSTDVAGKDETLNLTLAVKERLESTDSAA